VSPSYFQTLGLHLLLGRRLNEHDLAGSPLAAVINETMRRKYLPNQSPIGKRILIQQIVPGKTQLGPERAWEVVGVVADERVTDLDNKRDSPGVYVTNEQSPVYFGGIVARTSINPELVRNALRNAVYQVSKDQPLTDIKTVDQLKNGIHDQRSAGILFACHIRRRCTGAFGYRNLWRGFVFRGAADE
jgi:putative ABC transport system permease protein